MHAHTIQLTTTHNPDTPADAGDVQHITPKILTKLSGSLNPKPGGTKLSMLDRVSPSCPPWVCSPPSLSTVGHCVRVVHDCSTYSLVFCLGMCVVSLFYDIFDFLHLSGAPLLFTIGLVLPILSTIDLVCRHCPRYIGGTKLSMLDRVPPSCPPWVCSPPRLSTVGHCFRVVHNCSTYFLVFRLGMCVVT